MRNCVLFIALLISGLVMAQVQHVKRADDPRTQEQYQADCAAGLSLSSCGLQPVSMDCEPGKHWTLEGTGYAHCVLDDMACPDGTKLEHDNLGNPSCKKIICPPDTVLVGKECVPYTPPPPPPPSNPLTAFAFDGGAYIVTARYALANGDGRPYFICLMFKGDGTWNIYYTEFHQAMRCRGIPTIHRAREEKIPDGTFTLPYMYTKEFSHIYTNTSKPFTGVWTSNPSLPYEYSFEYYTVKKPKTRKSTAWIPLIPSRSDDDFTGVLFSLNQHGVSNLSGNPLDRDYFRFNPQPGWPTTPPGMVGSADSDWMTLRVRVVGRPETVTSAQVKFSSLFTSDGRVGN